MNPVLIQIGPFQVHWYGLLIVMARWSAACFWHHPGARPGRRSRARLEPADLVPDPGHHRRPVVSRLLNPTGNFAGWPYYREHPIDIIKFWDSTNGVVGLRGLGIFGAIIGGVLAVVRLLRVQ